MKSGRASIERGVETRGQQSITSVWWPMVRRGCAVLTYRFGRRARWVRDCAVRLAVDRAGAEVEPSGTRGLIIVGMLQV